MESIARTPSQIGAAIRRSREEAGLSQGDLGSLVGLAQSKISQIENGFPGARIGTICDLLAALAHEFTIQPRSKSTPQELEDLF